MDGVGDDRIGPLALILCMNALWFLNRGAFFSLWFRGTFRGWTGFSPVHIFAEDVASLAVIDDNDSGSWILDSQFFGSIRNWFSILNHLLDEILPSLHHISSTFVEIFALCFFLYKNLMTLFLNYYGRAVFGCLFTTLAKFRKLFHFRALIILIIESN